MIEIRTQYSPMKQGLDVYVIRTDMMEQTREALVPGTSSGGEGFFWMTVDEGASLYPTFTLREDAVPKLIDDLNRDGMGVDEGAEGTVTKHKDDLKEILDKVLPCALREEAY